MGSVSSMLGGAIRDQRKKREHAPAEGAPPPIP